MFASRGNVEYQANKSFWGVSAGRVGKIVANDGSDVPLKVAFNDGLLPTSDWFQPNAAVREDEWSLRVLHHLF